MAKESGNKLTQAMDSDGNLVSVAELENPEEVTVADIRKELFESTDVVMDKNNDHGLSEVMKNQDPSSPSEESEPVAPAKKKRGRKKGVNTKV